MTSHRPVRVERAVSDPRLRWRSSLATALLLSAAGLTISFVILGAFSSQLIAQTSTQSPVSSAQVPTPPPGGIDLDAIGAKKLPEGPGKEIVETSCKDCHTFDRITMAHHSLTRWRTIVREMEQKGANVDPGDLGPLVQYLAKNFGLRHTAAKPASRAPSHPPAH